MAENIIIRQEFSVVREDDGADSESPKPLATFATIAEAHAFCEGYDEGYSKACEES